jgi:hypothetical protein
MRGQTERFLGHVPCHRAVLRSGNVPSVPNLPGDNSSGALFQEAKMIRQVIAIVLISTAAIGVSGSARVVHSTRQEPCSQDHRAWVTQALQKMKTIRTGMTRDELLKVFTTEGGLSTGLNRRFVSRDCPYFKVDVEFRAVGRADRDSDGRVTLAEDPRDVIVGISQPYLQFSISD